MGARCGNYAVRRVYLDDVTSGKPDSFDEKLKPGLIYVESATRKDEPTFVQMTCPCGCGSELGMIVGRPVVNAQVWALTLDAEGTPTLTPSVSHRVGCKSHFFLRNGRIDWC